MTPFDHFIAPANARVGWWRPVAGMLVILLVWILGVVLSFSGWILAKAVSGMPLDQAVNSLTALETAASPAAIMVILAGFLGIWVGMLVVVRGIHRQSFADLLGPRRGVVAGLLLGLGFSAASVALSFSVAGPPEQVLAASEWAVFVIPVLILIVFQAAGEELIFRGYLLQQLAVRARSPLIWAVLPSFAFGLLHIGGDLPGAGALFYVAITAILGAAFAALVWRSGSLWPAAAAHVAINAVSLTLIGGEGILSGVRLWQFPAAELESLFAAHVALATGMLIFVLSPMGRVFAPARQD